MASDEMITGSITGVSDQNDHWLITGPSLPTISDVALANTGSPIPLAVHV